MTYPDKGGTADQFAKVSRAYLVLSDPLRRAKYDETGDIPEITPESAPLNILVQYFVTVVSMFCAGQGPDPRHVNLVKQAREQFRKDIVEAKNAQVKIRRTIKIWQDVAERFSSKKKADAVKLSLSGQVPRLEQQLRIMEEQVHIRQDALKLLDGYTFSFDELPQQVQTWQFHTS